MNKKSDIVLRAIGVISTPFNDRYDAPRQPGVDAPQIGIITLNEHENFEQALHDLDGFEKIWLLYLFDRNPNWKPKVMPPRGTIVKRGVFATRSPHRPNPIGLSLVDLVEVKGRTVKVSGVDLLDQTPILDIKPYLPFVESFPNAKAGWLEKPELAENSEASESANQVSPEITFEVRWSTIARKQSDFLVGNYKIDLVSRAEKVLSANPETHSYRRIKATEKGSYHLAIRSWRLLFRVQGSVVTIKAIQSGYSAEELARKRNSELHDGAAHKAFRKIWVKG